MKYNPLNAYAAGIFAGIALMYGFSDHPNAWTLLAVVLIAQVFAWLRPIP